MKDHDSFDNSLFTRLLFVVAAVALVCVIVFVIIGAVRGDDLPDAAETTAEPYETYLFDDVTTAAPVVTDAPETTAAPLETTAAPADTTAAPADTTAPAETTAAPVTTPTPTSAVLLPETADMGQSYIDAITFFGDSTTYGMGPYAVLKDGKQTTQVWTPANGTLTLDQAVKKKIKYPETGEEITAAEAAGRKKPAYLIITLGVNGISFMNEEQFVTEYTKLVQSIQAASPDSKIMLQSIFPVGANWAKPESINNQKIVTANGWVVKVAEACGVRYLDTISVLMGDDGYLPAAYQNGDGMHFNAEGYRVVLNYIRTHGWPAA